MYMKECRKCGVLKPLELFAFQQKHGFRGTGVGNYRPDCKECVAEAAREYRKTYLPKGRVVRRDVDRKLYSACQARVQDARQRSKDVSIDTDFMYSLFEQQAGKCALSGMLMSLTKGDPAVLSIDQKVPGAGYTSTNVQWVRWDANRAKGDLSMEEFLGLCQAIVRCNDYPAREYVQVDGSAHQQRC